MAEIGDVLDVAKLDPSFCDEVAAQPGGEHVRRCYACGTCVAGCPVSEVSSEFSPRRVIRQILFGMREEVLSSPAIWTCLVCYRCHVHCPQGVNFPDIMRAVRYLAIRGEYAPPDAAERLAEIDLAAQKERVELIHSQLSEAFAEFAERRASSAKGAADDEEESA
ncbi:MAG: 4Fe-4S dicluster domain-containing protein [Candidatus Bipolaricaulota bacterium]|nr:MAG: 4Fe-4S dicluster domain-containing protein [Candidatus Bipolaricaulota bacterium]